MEKIRKGVYRLKVDRAIQVVMELQAKEPETSDQAGRREVGKGENSTIGCSVADWMLEYFGVTDYDSFGFREDPVWRNASPEDILRMPAPPQADTFGPRYSYSYFT